MQQSGHTGAERRRVLLIDDNERLREAAARALEYRDIDVVQAADGEAASALLENGTYALVITDVMMPGISGFDLIPIVRRRQPAARILVFSAVTEDTDHTDDEMKDRLGVEGFLSKPCTAETLLERVDALLS